MISIGTIGLIKAVSSFDATKGTRVRRKKDNVLFYGAGRHENIDKAAILALFTALNKAILDERQQDA